MAMSQVSFLRNNITGRTHWQNLNFMLFTLWPYKIVSFEKCKQPRLKQYSNNLLLNLLRNDKISSSCREMLEYSRTYDEIFFVNLYT